MLVSLHVKNVALIDEVEVYFSKGLNILSGETGAGKSILIGSINLALGERADADFIRTGADQALVEMVFQISNQEQIAWMRSNDIQVEEDGMILLQRRVMPGRSVCKVCGEIMPIRKVRELASILLQIHGQTETQTLFEQKKQRDYVDMFAGREMEILKDEMRRQYASYQKAKKEVEEFSKDERMSMKELDLAKYEFAEIDDANLVIGEDVELEKRHAFMENSKKIADRLYESKNVLSEEDGILEQLARLIRSIRDVSSFDENIEKMFHAINDADGILTDVSREISYYVDQLDFSEEEYHEVYTRLNIINHLKDKYGQSITDILAYKDKTEAVIERLENKDRYMEKSKALMLEYEMACEKKANEISALRVKHAKTLQDSVVKALMDLNFLSAEFEILVQSEEEFHASGRDEVVFMISTNPGEPKKPLASVASGGELSRIMLALKTIMAKNEEVESIIFDEIDAGVSGKTAWKVSEKLGAVAKDQQVICITHLPQIAAMADAHYLIEKSSANGSTKTNIRELNAEESLDELARMLGGEVISFASKQNAREMKEMAELAKTGLV